MRRTLATLAAVAAAAAPKNETYAVLAYGRGGGATLGALVLGNVLRRVDPDRGRTALVYGISDDAAAALRARSVVELLRLA